MKTKSSSPTEPEPNGRKAPKPRKHRLRVPEVKAGEGIVGLLPEEEAFIQEEIALRTELGWSQAKVAKLSGLDRATVQHYEHRRRGPSLRAAILISRAFGRKLEDYQRQARRWLPTLQLLFGSLDLTAVA